MAKTPQKMVLRLNYTRYVFDEDVAIEMFKLLNRSEVEVVDNKWDSDTKTSTEYVKRLKDDIFLQRMAPDSYAVLKLAATALEEQGK